MINLIRESCNLEYSECLIVIKETYEKMFCMSQNSVNIAEDDLHIASIATKKLNPLHLQTFPVVYERTIPDPKED